jgi:hypothetical protein
VDNQNSYSWMYAVVFVVALAVFGTGLYLAIQGHGWAMLAAGSASLIAVLIAWPIALSIGDSRDAGIETQRQMQAMLEARLQQLESTLNRVSQQQLLSDRAKSVVYRDNERQAIRRAINEEIAQQDWEAALALAQAIEDAFGYRQEADRLRAEIRQRQQDTQRRQVNDALGVIERHLRAEQWAEATREAERLRERYPKDEQVQRLPQEIESRREAFKQHLLRNWRDARARKDNDAAIDLLRQLDFYLTPAEAESIQEDARAVFRERLDGLRQQFSQAVQEHRWSDAIRVGDSIVEEFPNSGIAREVREKMDALRQRAAEPEAATA